MSRPLPFFVLALALLLLAMSPVSLGGIMISDQTFSACPGKEQLPLAFVNGTAEVASNSTGHIIVHTKSSIHVASSFTFVNGSERSLSAGHSVASHRLFRTEYFLLVGQHMPIVAGSDVFFEVFVYFPQPTRYECDLQVYDANMDEIGCVTLGYTVTDDSARLSALPASDVPARDIAIAPAPTSSSYIVAVEEWSNCRASDPVQVVDFDVTVALNQAVSELLVLSTAVNIVSGMLVVNATLYQASGGGSSQQLNVYDFTEWAVEFYPMPWLAGSWAVPLAATWDVAGSPSMRRVANYSLYDQSMQEVGCFSMSATVTAPSSPSPSAPAQQPSDQATTAAW